MRKKLSTLVVFLLSAFFFMQPAFASRIVTEVACPVQPMPRIVHPHHLRPIVRAYRPYRYSVTLYPGSLKYNIVRIGNSLGWRTVVWNAPEDYLWVGRAQISANSLTALFNKILFKYPLQAQFFYGNHVLAIVPRNLP